MSSIVHTCSQWIWECSKLRKCLFNAKEVGDTPEVAVFHSLLCKLYTYLCAYVDIRQPPQIAMINAQAQHTMQ